MFILLILNAYFILIKFIKNDSRRNILLSKFGFNENGTFDFILSNFTIPEAVVPPNDDNNKYVSFLIFFVCNII